MTSKDDPVKLYKEGKISLGKAAESLGVSTYKFLEIIEKKDISLSLDEKDIKEAVNEI